MTLGEARDSVSSVAVAEGGKEVFAGSVDGRVRVYDCEPGSWRRIVWARA